MDLISSTSKYLFDYQRKLLCDQSRYIVFEKSRRIGGTFIIAFKAICESFEHGYNVWFSSNDFTNGIEFVRYVKQWSEIINAILGFEYIKLADSTTECVNLPNGCRITTLSSSPDTLRGKDGIIILDEVAARNDQEELFTAAQGCIIQKGKLYCLSTHNGPATKFFEIAAAAPSNGWSKHTVTLHDAIKQGYAVRFAKHLHHLLPDVDALNEAFIAEIKSITLSEEQFRQEYECQPVSLQALISPQEYDALALWEVPDTLDPERKYNPLHIGIDVGRTHDLTVLWASEEYENPKATGPYDRFDYKTVCKIEIRNHTIPAQWERLRPIVLHPAVSTISIDQGAVGRSLADLVLEAFPSANLENFTLPFKAKIAERVKGYVQYKRISLPPDQATRTDILSMKRVASKSGNLTYEGGTKESHADRFWALALSLEAANSSTGAELV